MYDYNEFIQRALQPRIIHTVQESTIGNFMTLFPKDSPIVGDRITEQFRVAKTTNAAAYTKTDANPSPGSQTLVKPYWTKVQYHDSVEVSKIDISNASPEGRLNLVQDAIDQCAASVYAAAKAGMLSQILADVDSSATAYSDKSLSRSTYATLASYEETTNAAITDSYVLAMIKGTMLGKNCGPRSGYLFLVEDAVWGVYEPILQALHTWPQNDPKMGQVIDGGYQEVQSAHGIRVFVDNDMTTGTIYLLRQQDVRLTIHRPLEIEQVESGADSVMFVVRFGANLHVLNPYFQGKMLDKD